MTLEEAADLGKNVSPIDKSESCTVFRLQDSTGDGLMRVYPVFPGVSLLYNDFHLESCTSYFRPGTDMFCIDHCREGRLEWEMEDGRCQYMEAGDLQMSTRVDHAGMFRFPLRHYHGITVALCLEEAGAVLPGILAGFSVDVNALRDKFCSKGQLFIMRAGASIEHIFSELYSVPETIRDTFFKIKVLEMLLFLSTLEIPEGSRERPYFYKTQVEKVKSVMALITENPQHHYTLEQLSVEFDFPITAMKNCFKGVYGTSIYAYSKSYRMNAAAIKLRQTKESITTIAQQMGYDNASKFAAAFKSVMGMTPAEYRKSIV
ncbi:AraC family transcriptional regulator [Desulfitobacterium sp. LBE]|uniref:Transcriptional regulator n=3 Tax=root TaxID=1 RepID=A0A098B847_DESHA|nr:MULTISPECIES: AraC family transcriptional regulator [Desulfitobacterium]ACL22766.1 transcriptional regulator, AraC family [Desulfitobacterium hafniense DCB-2]KTE93577.1 AraC family transcriptional regulator [Desulfitobacterium hafniense]MEA5021999.1 AraC family transcriptional regulator [Desulfitobacterium hafniense]TWH59209.1 AraC family transcriptional regulator [Desulfitobacterium sp. LBE]CDX05034.1 Transcriptional regulator [Desulfitobacterium hafniense]